MITGPYRILACPRCGEFAAMVSLFKRNTPVPDHHTDGGLRPRNMPEPPAIAKCRGCGVPFWIEDAPIVWEHGEPERPELMERAARVGEPSEELLDEALACGLATDRKRELCLRYWLWRAGGLEGRDASDGARRRNIEALAALLDETNTIERMEMAELARQLGRFDEARRLIDHPFWLGTHHRVAAIARLIEQGRTEVAIVRGDEAYTEEEKREREVLAESYRAIHADRQAEREAVTGEREQALERGLIKHEDRCPGCGFSYAWSGVTCHHCHYPAPKA